MSALPDRVRSSCAAVAARARHVRIVHERLVDFLDALPNLAFELPVLDAASHDTGRGEHTVAYMLTLNAINFGSGYFADLRPYVFEGRSFHGYFAVAAALKNLALTETLTTELLARLTAEDCSRIFAQENVPELMEHFSEALREFGEYLLREFGGSFTRLIEAAEGSATRLVEILTGMSYFRDVSESGGEEIYFLKRAQLVAADLSLAFGGRGLGRFDDLDRLTIFADNQVPHVLHVDGLLEYTPKLASRIASREPLPAGSEEEIEIRACAVHAAELLLAELRRRGCDVSAVRLDYFLWNRGEGERYKRLPAHVTRSIFY